MPGFEYTREEIVARAGRDPWERQARFSAEIDPEEMARTAAAYQRASGEADDAVDLGQEASRLAAEAGDLDGASLVDDAGRIRMTTGHLDIPGMEAAVHGVQRAMNLAVDAEQVVRAMIWDPGLELSRAQHGAAAEIERQGWQAELERVAPATGTETITLSYRGEMQEVVPALNGAGLAVYGLPPSLIDRIRERHLADAVESALSYDDAIADEIESYRHRLSTYAAELGSDAPGLAGGPLGIFTTPEMAAYAASGLKEELSREHPRSDVLDRWTRVLDGIARGVWGTTHYNPLADSWDPVRPMTDAEAAYLREFYSHLTAEELSDLGRRLFEDEWVHQEDGPHVTGIGGMSAGTALTNGIQLLMNPEIGGLDLTTPAGRAATPDFVKEHVLNEDIQYWNPAWSDEELENAEAHLHFGSLLGTATVPTGTAYADRLEIASSTLQDSHHTSGSYYRDWYESFDDPPNPATFEPVTFGLVPGNDGFGWAASRDPGHRNDVINSLQP
ncbi:hypothetical protein [Streptomyces avicenniae]|uniref:putative alpha/beta hydrolase n=1 Tax=Streptomyces avicenniae TaxID=500153 RepID=UPI0006995BD4|nr:hypothetical protein [Streptomyces avicenniae]